MQKEVKMLLLQAKGEKMKEQQSEHDSETSMVIFHFFSSYNGIHLHLFSF